MEELEKNYRDIQNCLDKLNHIDSFTEDERKVIADEAMNVYAPIADKLGLHHELHELQELGFKYSNPEKYKELKQLLADSEAMCAITFKTFTLPICSMLDATGIKYTISYRMKSTYSIYRKMMNKGVEFDDVYDLFACRVVYEPSEGPLENLKMAGEMVGRELDDSFVDREKLDCWRIFTVFTSLYRITPDRIRDWITHPRPSGYQALQFTVMGPDCNWIEVQVRSKRMDDEAENGVAAHWKYKEGQVKI